MTDQNKMKLEDKLNMLEEAAEMIVKAQDLVQEASGGRMDTYLKGNFNTLLGNGNPYDMSLPKLAEEFEKEGDN